MTVQQSELLQIHTGKETTWGTAVSSGLKLGGIESCTIDPDVEVGDFPTLEGLAPIYNAAVLRRAGMASIGSLAGYEDINRWLDCLFATDATPGGTAAPYTRAYAAPGATAATPGSMTLYLGSGASGYNLAGGVVSSLEISGSSQEKLSLSVELLGKSAAAEATPAATPSTNTFNMILGQHISIYMAAFGTATGAMETNSLLACNAYQFSLSINPNRTLRYGFDGSITPCGHHHGRWDGELSLTLEFPGEAVTSGIGANATKTLLDSIIAGTLIQRNFRIKATTGAGAALKLFQVDFAGTVMNSPTIFSDSDGVSTVELNLKGTYDSAGLGNWLLISTSCSLADVWA